MWKKLSVLLVAITVLFAATAPAIVDAKGVKTGKRSFNSNTQKSNVTNNSTNTTKTPGSTTTTKPGFFSGGSFMKGMMVGGLAGLLFGGLFGGMGFMGEILGLMVNLIAIFALIVLVMKIVDYFKKRRKPEEKRY